ncbi:MAG: DUF4349 domain-containing protein [Leptospirales bacterium]
MNMGKTGRSISALQMIYNFYNEKTGKYSMQSNIKAKIMKGISIMAIGIPPENFDKTVKELSGIGNLKSIVINKTDKTNDYNKLTAKKKSLEKTKNALIKLNTVLLLRLKKTE